DAERADRIHPSVARRRDSDLDGRGARRHAVPAAHRSVQPRRAQSGPRSRAREARGAPGVLRGAVRRLLRLAPNRSPPIGGVLAHAWATGADAAILDDRVFRDGQRHRSEEFRRLLADEIRHRLLEVKGLAAVADMSRTAIEDVDFLGATPAQLREMRHAIRPLARKLAARIAHRRRFRRHGRLDARRTIRRSLSAGGVPLEPAFRYPRVSKADL